MRFEYNKHLTFDRRVDFVVKEIIDAYPLIDTNHAYVAAILCSPVDDKATNDEKFSRYYFLLRTIGRNSEEFNHVLNDAFTLFSDGLGYVNKRIMLDIINFVADPFANFPEIYDYV